jgi:hypothetical protein
MPSHSLQTVLSAHLDGESFLLEMKDKSYFRINETGQAIWSALESGLNAEGVVSQLVSTFMCR